MTSPSKPDPIRDPDVGPKLIALLSEQRAAYQALSHLSDGQAGLIAAGDSESLLEVLGKRQQVIDQLAAISQKLKPYREAWDGIWECLATDVRGRVQSLVEQVQALVKQIVAADAQDYENLAKQRDTVGASIQRVQKGAVVNRAYGAGQGAVATARFTDQEG